MNAYRTYWLLTAVLTAAVVLAVEQGLILWGMTKFPEWEVQLALLAIVLVFAWAYGFIGHKAALVLKRAERELHMIASEIRVIPSWRGDVHSLLAAATSLRKSGTEIGQSDFSLLYERTTDKMQNILEQQIARIDRVRVFLFFVGLFFTLIGVVQGFATQQFPTNPEEAKLYSFTIIKALGLAYLPATACIGSTLALYVLSNMLQERAGSVAERFGEVLYRVAILGEAAIATQSRVQPAKAEGGRDAQVS